MSNALHSREEYIDTLKELTADESLSTEDIIRRLSLLIPSELRNDKCPDVPSEELQEGINSLIYSFWDFVKVEDNELWKNNQAGNCKDIDINLRNLSEVVSRTYKRREYYRYFHNITKVSELKHTALTCFWLIKLKPFTVLNNNSPLRLSVNEKFSLNLILSQISYFLTSKGKEFKMPDKCFIQDTLYSFKYRDLSKEAMILFVDSVANAYGITIDSWL